MAENIVLKVIYDTSEAIPSAKGLEKVMNSTTKQTDELNSSLATTSKELSDFDKNIKGGADGLANLAKSKKAFNDISIASSTKEVKDLANELQNVLMKDKEFMKVSKEVANEVNKGTISNQEAFKILEDAINKGVDSLKGLKDKTEETVKKTTTLRQEIKELTNLINSGKLKGDELLQAKQRVGDLKDKMGDLSAQTKILGSDTRALDTAMQGLSLGVGIFASLQGATALFGVENEKVQQALLKVNGAMALLQGLQQIQNTLDAESGFLISAKTYATSAYGVALRVVTAIQTAFGVSSATAWAIATAGISVLIGAIGLLIYNYKEVTKYVTDLLGITEKLTAEQKLQKQYTQDYANVQKQVIENGSKEIANVVKLGIAIKDQNLPQEQRLLALKEYNKLADQSNKIDETQINNSKLVEDSLKRQTDLIIKKALAKASENEIESIVQSSLQARLEVSAVEKTYGEFLKMTKEQIGDLLRANDKLAISFVNNSTNYFKNLGIIEDANARIRKLVSLSPVDIIGDTNSDISKKLIDKYKKGGSGGEEKALAIPVTIDVQNGDAIEKKLQDAIQEFTLIIPVVGEVDVEKSLKAVENLRNTFQEATNRIGGDFSKIFGDIGNVATALFDIKELKKAIETQKNIIKIAYSDLVTLKSEYNSKLLKANEQLQQAEKSGDTKRIESAKKSVSDLNTTYEESSTKQMKSIAKAEDDLKGLDTKLVEKSTAIASGVLKLFQGINQAIGFVISKNIERIDGLMEKQKQSIEFAKDLADKGNSQLLDAELKKQDKLEQLRRAESQKLKKVKIAEAVINTAIGITDVWAKWAYFPAVAGVLSGLVAALGAVQIGVIASQTFRKGGVVPSGMMEGASHEQGGIKFGVRGRKEMYEMEGNEFIFNRETSIKNHKWFDKINKEKLNLDDLIGNNITPMSLNPIMSNTFVNQNGQLEERIRSVENILLDLPSKMPTAQFNADVNGLSMKLKRVIDKEKAWKR